MFASQAGNASSESLSESDSRSTGGSALLDALSLPDAAATTAAAANKLEHDPRLAPHLPHLPHILDTCFKHIESHGE